MPISRRLRKTVIGVYALSFAIYTPILGIAWRGGAVAVVLGSVTMGPAGLFLCGIRWARFFVGSISLLLLFLWALSPLALHEVDRTGLFWLFWPYFGVVLVATTLASFIKPKK